MTLDHEHFLEAARLWSLREEVKLDLSKSQISSLAEQLEYAYEAGRRHVEDEATDS